MTQSYLDEITNDQRTDDSLRMRIEELSVAGYHNWAHQLFELTESFVSKVRNV
jgi:hypothetical protein